MTRKIIPFLRNIFSKLGFGMSTDANTHVQEENKVGLEVPHKSMKLNCHSLKAVNKAKGFPKGYISAFNWFLIDQTPTVSNKTSLEKNTANRLLGERWKSLSGEEKEIYEDKALKDKLRYLQEIDAFNKSTGFTFVPRINPPSGYGLNGLKLSSDTKLPIKGQVMKRPLTAYSYFSRQEKAFVLELDQQSSNLQSVMGKFFSNRWSTMDSEEKQLYEQLFYVDSIAKQSKSK